MRESALIIARLLYPVSFAHSPNVLHDCIGPGGLQQQKRLFGSLTGTPHRSWTRDSNHKGRLFDCDGYKVCWRALDIFGSSSASRDSYRICTALLMSIISISSRLRVVGHMSRDRCRKIFPAFRFTAMDEHITGPNSRSTSVAPLCTAGQSHAAGVGSTFEVRTVAKMR